MSVTNYPAQSFEAMTRKQAITTCYALEDMRDRAVAEIERLRVVVALLEAQGWAALGGTKAKRISPEVANYLAARGIQP